MLDKLMLHKPAVLRPAEEWFKLNATQEYSITARAAVSISVMLRKNLWKYLTAPVPPDDIRCETQS